MVAFCLNMEHPIGSGVVECVCRHLVCNLMERTVMKWETELLRATRLAVSGADGWTRAAMKDTRGIAGEPAPTGAMVNSQGREPLERGHHQVGSPEGAEVGISRSRYPRPLRYEWCKDLAVCRALCKVTPRCGRAGAQPHCRPCQGLWADGCRIPGAHALGCLEKSVAIYHPSRFRDLGATG